MAERKIETIIIKGKKFERYVGTTVWLEKVS